MRCAGSSTAFVNCSVLKWVLVLLVMGMSLPVSADTMTWSAPIDLSAAGKSAGAPQIKLSSDGTRGTAIWKRENGTNSIIQSASVTISGGAAAWGTTSDISMAGQSAFGPQLALSPDGNKAIAVWHRYNGSNYIVQSAIGVISGNTAVWSAASDLSAPGQSAMYAQVAISSDGTKATAMWHRSNGDNFIIQSASATISGGIASWGAVTDLSAVGQSAMFARLGLSSDGCRATAVWYRHNGVNYIVQTSSAAISGNTAQWSAPADLSASGNNATDAQVKLSSDGTKAVAVWVRSNGTNQIVQSANAAVSGNTASWSAAVDLSDAGFNSQNPQVGLSSDGSMATAVWSITSGSPQPVYAASATISGSVATWGLASAVSSTLNAAYPQVGVSSDGTRAVVVWQARETLTSFIQSTYASISGNTATWDAVMNLTAADRNAWEPLVSISSDGAAALAVWYRSNGTNDIVQAAAMQSSAPPTPAPTATPIVEPTSTPVPTPQALSCSLSVAAACKARGGVKKGKTCAFVTTVKTVSGKAAFAGADIVLNRKPAKKRTWTAVSSGVSGAKGTLSLRVKMSKTASFQSVVNHGLCKSKAVNVTVR